jgi:hypothetical protein
VNGGIINVCFEAGSFTLEERTGLLMGMRYWEMIDITRSLLRFLNDSSRPCDLNVTAGTFDNPAVVAESDSYYRTITVNTSRLNNARPQHFWEATAGHETGHQLGMDHAVGAQCTFSISVMVPAIPADYDQPLPNTLECADLVFAYTIPGADPGGGGGGGDDEGCYPEGGNPFNCPENYTWVDELNGCFPYQSPLMIGVTAPIKLSSRKQGVVFDISGTGAAWQLSWPTSPDTGFVVWDRNGNGRIDNGLEMFGNFTRLAPGLRAGNGFIALSEYDANGDYVIDWRDEVWGRLRLWIDGNVNGVSEPEELMRLDDLRIESLDLRYTESSVKDKEGNWFRYVSDVTIAGSSRRRPVVDVYLVPGSIGVRPMQALAPCQ